MKKIYLLLVIMHFLLGCSINRQLGKAFIDKSDLNSGVILNSRKNYLKEFKEVIKGSSKITLVEKYDLEGYLHGRIYIDSLSYIFRSSLVDGHIMSLKEIDVLTEDSLLISMLENNKYDSIKLMNDSIKTLNTTTLYVTMFREKDKKNPINSYRFVNWVGLSPVDVDM